LTVDKIAACAGAGKATIYRRWSGKAELVVDALTFEKIAACIPDTGTLEGDLNALACRASEIDTQLDLSVMVGLVSALPHDEELRDVFRERLVEPHVATLTVIFRRAELRGEIEPVEDLGTITSILPALVMHRLLVTGTLPDQTFIEHIIRGVILPLVSAKTPQQPTL
jgi:AcrR family transcriptional regulator